MLRFRILLDPDNVLKNALISNLYSKDELVAMWKLSTIVKKMTHLHYAESLGNLGERLLETVFGTNDPISMLSINIAPATEVSENIWKFVRTNKAQGVEFSKKELEDILKQTW